MNFDTEVFAALKKAQAALALETRAAKDRALAGAARAIGRNRERILAANALDAEKARKAGMKEALLDRLRLTGGRIDGIIRGIETVTGQEDPAGRVLAGWRTPAGLLIERVAAPLGVVAIIYESRPNVTAEAASLAYKAGCGILLRGSSAALESNRAITEAFREGLAQGGGVPEAVALAGGGGREEVAAILSARGALDAVIPRGGRALIRRVVEEARVPVIETGEGNCHIYVDPSADMEKAVAIIDNAKTQKPGACNAVETLLVHIDAAPALMPRLAERFARSVPPVELRCDGPSRRAVGTPPPGLPLKDASEEDWETEFLDYILAVKTVSSVEEAVSHINRYGTGHSEAILTNDLASAERFCREVDAACVYTNASTRFTDGGEFGFGAELGISTQKFHARGPMGAEALTTIKYRITGTGQVRG